MLSGFRSNPGTSRHGQTDRRSDGQTESEKDRFAISISRVSQRKSTTRAYANTCCYHTPTYWYDVIIQREQRQYTC